MAQQVCSWVGYQVCLSPASALKPGSARKQVALGLAGESPGKRGRKFKVGAKLLEAASLRASLSQANGAEQGGREILQTLKAATAGTKHDADVKGQELNGWLMKRGVVRCGCGRLFGGLHGVEMRRDTHPRFSDLAESLCPPLKSSYSLDTDLTRNTRATHFTPQHWLLCHIGLY